MPVSLRDVDAAAEREVGHGAGVVAGAQAALHVHALAEDGAAGGDGAGDVGGIDFGGIVGRRRRPGAGAGAVEGQELVRVGVADAGRAQALVEVVEPDAEA